MLTRLLSLLRRQRTTPAAVLAPPPATPTPTRPQVAQVRPCSPASWLPKPDRRVHISRLRFGDYIDRQGCVEMVVEVDNTIRTMLTVRTDHAMLTFPRAHPNYLRMDVDLWYSRPGPHRVDDPTEPF